jgi:hypothetical protein
MSREQRKPYVPPFTKVRLLECRDFITLAPVASSREFFAYGKKKVRDFTPEEAEGSAPFMEFHEPDDEIWVVMQWIQFEDGHRETGNLAYLRPPSTEEDAKRAMQRMIGFHEMSREDLIELSKCFKAAEEDLAYIDNRHPNYQSQPDPRDSQAFDVYQARLKVLAGLHPQTVALVRLAEAAKDPAKRTLLEREALQAYFAELAHHWSNEEVLAWQRSNPVGTQWLCQFAAVMKQPRRKLDAVNHELALNWLRKKYHLLTAEELAQAVATKTGKPINAKSVKSRRTRLGLVTKRPPGPRPKAG